MSDATPETPAPAANAPAAVPAAAAPAAEPEARSAENQAQETHAARLRRKRRQRQTLLRPFKTLVRLPQRNRNAYRQKSRNLSLRILQDTVQTELLEGAA